jgi:hypothetical protein
MKHDAEDGRDAAARARAGAPRPRPIRYNTDTWLVMRNDPVLPAAVIIRLRNPDGSEFFVAVRWDLYPEKRRLVGRFGSLREADASVLFQVPRPVVGAPEEEVASMRARQEEHAQRLEREQMERAKLYGP